MESWRFRNASLKKNTTNEILELKENLFHLIKIEMVNAYSSLKLTNDKRINNSIVSLSMVTFSGLVVLVAIGFKGTFVGCFMSLKSKDDLLSADDDVLHARVMLTVDLIDAFRKNVRHNNTFNMILY